MGNPHVGLVAEKALGLNLQSFERFEAPCESPGIGFLAYGPLLVDRRWGIWGSCYNIPKAMFYLLEGDYRASRVWGGRYNF